MARLHGGKQEREGKRSMEERRCVYAGIRADEVMSERAGRAPRDGDGRIHGDYLGFVLPLSSSLLPFNETLRDQFPKGFPRQMPILSSALPLATDLAEMQRPHRSQDIPSLIGCD